MTTPLEVSKVKATHQYFTDMPNLLLTAGVVGFWGKHLVSLLGREISDFPSLEKIASTTSHYFIFYDFSSIINATYSVFSVLKDGVQVLRGKETQNKIREKRKGDIPRATTPYIGRTGAWMTYKSAAAVFKATSSFFLVHAACKQFGVISKGFSPMVRAAASGIGIVGIAIDVMDIGRAYYEYQQEGQEEALLGQGKVVSDHSTREDLLYNSSETRTMACRLIQGNRKFDVALKVLGIGLKIMGGLRALDMLGSLGLVGRISKFAASNAENLYGVIMTAMNLTGLAQHVLYGATIQELDNKKSKAFLL